MINEGDSVGLQVSVLIVLFITQNRFQACRSVQTQCWPDVWLLFLTQGQTRLKVSYMGRWNIFSTLKARPYSNRAPICLLSSRTQIPLRLIILRHLLKDTKQSLDTYIFLLESYPLHLLETTQTFTRTWHAHW